ncbi:hypothetical protein EUGRSUZ_C01145 [Eucalyptus grandis]|uniref:Uncharacterized protein n=2 Tax=Eucalyptus grandis TaxID=71139 RepID=A0ACC3LCQ8_EUCGR|nr:hypothetical protein EUGRSUZ_C01145 [Eucalyptus grandis]
MGQQSILVKETSSKTLLEKQGLVAAAAGSHPIDQDSAFLRTSPGFPADSRAHTERLCAAASHGLYGMGRYKRHHQVARTTRGEQLSRGT